MEQWRTSSEEERVNEMREGSGRGDAAIGRRPVSRGAVGRTHAREVARNGDRAAVHRRSKIDRSVAWESRQECHAMREPRRDLRRDPHHRTTRWHSLPRDRRGAGGGRTRPSSGRDVAPARLHLRRHDADAGRYAGQGFPHRRTPLDRRGSHRRPRPRVWDQRRRNERHDDARPARPGHHARERLSLPCSTIFSRRAPWRSSSCSSPEAPLRRSKA